MSSTTTVQSANVINSLINDYAETARQERARFEAEKEQRSLETLDQANAAIKEQLPDGVWEELKPYLVSSSVDMAPDGMVRTLRHEIGALSQMVPFTILARAKNKYAHYHSVRFEDLAGYVVFLKQGNRDALAAEDAAHFFLALRETYRQAEEAKLEKELSNLRLKLTHSSYRVESEEEALNVARQLDDLAPNRTDEWAAALEDWRQAQKHEEERQARAEENQRRLKAYADAYRAYVRQERGLREQNRNLVAEVQARFDETFVGWKLTYSRVAHDPDYGEREIDTRSVHVLNEKPDEAGYWNVVRRGQVKRIRYENVVSIQGPLHLQANPDGIRVTIQVPAYETFYAAPHREDELQAAIEELREAWQPYPQEPDPAGYELSEGQTYSIPDGRRYRLSDVQDMVRREAKEDANV